MKDVTRELCFEKDNKYKKKMSEKYALYLANYAGDRKCVLVSPQAYWEAMGVTDENEISTNSGSLRNNLYEVFKHGTDSMYGNYIKKIRKIQTIPDDNIELKLEDNSTFVSKILPAFSYDDKSICGNGTILLSYFKSIFSTYDNLKVYTLNQNTLKVPLSFAIFDYDSKTSTLELVLTCSLNLDPPIIDKKRPLEQKKYYLSVYTVKSAFVDLEKQFNIGRVVLKTAESRLVEYYSRFYGFTKIDETDTSEEILMSLTDFEVIRTVEKLKSLKGAEVSAIPSDFTIHYVSACAQCAQNPNQVEVSGKMREFCGKPCQIKFYKL
jgi:hypothetical protein